MHEVDNVATAVRPLGAGENIRIKVGGQTVNITVTQSIPFGHKVALRDIKQGGTIIKYGETIGLATSDINTGEHVHLHNVEGLRGRGDRP